MDRELKAKSMQIYIDRGGERYGPYGIEDVNTYLANGTLLPTDLAWQDGMTDWVPISQIPGVVMPEGSAAIPIPPSQPGPNGNKKKILIGIGAGMGLLALMAGIWFFFIRDTEEKGQLANNADNNSTTAKPVKESPLERTWIGKSMEKDGEKVSKDIALRVRFRFSGDNLFMKGNSEDGREAECIFHLDEKQEPNHIDFTPPEENKPILGIYQCDGDSLKVCMRHGNSDKGRPTEFKTTPGSELILVVFALEK